jgi:hypothetical protein
MSVVGAEAVVMPADQPTTSTLRPVNAAATHRHRLSGAVDVARTSMETAHDRAIDNAAVMLTAVTASLRVASGSGVAVEALRQEWQRVTLRAEAGLFNRALNRALIGGALISHGGELTLSPLGESIVGNLTGTGTDLPEREL